MRVQSLVYDNYQHYLVEVEVTLHPGLPGVQILGLPDAVVKDCVWRIKSAFLHCGYQWPTGSQVIVNLKPSNLRKRGTGLDLAIAAAVIWKTGQSDVIPGGTEPPLLYGELDLLGEVHVPADFVHYSGEHEVVLTGRLKRGLPFACLSLSTLRGLSEPQVVPATGIDHGLKRPMLSGFKLSPQLAECLAVIAVGEHPTLFAGKAGTGKSTVAAMVHSLLAPPSGQLIQEYSKYHLHNPISWRPFRNPHSSTPPLSMIGGGVTAAPGELTRAHGGVLVMDEFLEFDTSVQEALREPMERGVIELIRSSKAVTLPAKFLLLATTNLCRCGAFEPGDERSCQCGFGQRRRYQDRLSGPILDRFGVVMFSQQWRGPKSESISTILERVEKALEFRRMRGQAVPNGELSSETLKQQLAPGSKAYFFDEDWVSERRAQHLLRVARSFADLEGSELIQLGHLEQARRLSMENISKLRRGNYERLPI